ncbi:alpha/beta-hydrolase [Saitoella complicata NRRL Y-17804]|uniref:Epoxide hydrolase N-terminal domain-containing protein n=1 Tax=Saitoella complicata (strain BCRC 22490 / CBS 7301 / JCM 7358 / NBRC 10748 / NRRL Y-17804) TaxID=698492 RepID=A0A0E9NHL0_SAICN|nr:alpha/beta-hydrolase [Saitoella complicata NRRL Y-17804]ODQ54102.1 alpha/beta-hydrolase [Saitoella complicata NRRL Y-17804]GAO49176.1 hypothetical protein G7K_3334-t1 [Saitoella complicata NRRL Y-17804]
MSTKPSIGVQVSGATFEAPFARPFTISIPDSFLDLTRQKLLLTRFPDELESSGWEYGIPLSMVQNLRDYWLEKYDWRKEEAKMNELENFKMRVPVIEHDTLDVHFVHRRSSRVDAIPLLFVHGWPGNFTEVTKILPLLTEPQDPSLPAFHVVAPSLPGYAFSEAPKKSGFGVAKMAECLKNLMVALGYDEFVCQGGDWGSWITRMLAHLYPQNCLALHLNFLYASPPPPSSPLSWLASKLPYIFYSSNERYGLARTAKMIEKGTGYQKIQSTRPQTLGYALTDSPVGLLAWIGEKLGNWVHGNVEQGGPWGPDDYITWTMLHWIPGPTPATRIYKEFTAERTLLTETPNFVRQPTGVSNFAKEIYLMPESWTRRLVNLRWSRWHGEGGHFAAWEKPEVLVEDVREFFGGLLGRELRVGMVKAKL